MPAIRTVRAEEYTDLHRFLERCFGHGIGWFQRHQPALYRTDDEALGWSLVTVEGERIVAHVGTYPMELAAGPVRITCGGIGNVATAPEARGKGYMSQLLEEAVQRMRERGWALSVLWGDRQRYGRFGWERGGQVLHLHINRRSLDGVEPAKIDELDPFDPGVRERIAPLHALLPYRAVRRGDLPHLKRRDIRIFVGPDGYVVTQGDRSGDPTILELVSPTEREPELILATLNRTAGSTAHVTCEAVDSPRIERMLAVSSTWRFEPQGMFRILNWPKLAHQIKPWLEAQAGGLPEFSLSVGCDWQSNVETATFHWNGKEMHVVAGRDADEYVSMDMRQLTRALFGGPAVRSKELGLLGRTLPVGLFIPRLDYV